MQSNTQQSPAEVVITVERDHGNNQWRISVADNGPGIPELERQTIESDEETPLGHSLGIDLWLMNWITTTLGGSLTITDNDPTGSVVSFHLPSGNSNDEERLGT